MEDFKSIGNGKTEVLRSSAIRFIENITAECILHNTTRQIFIWQKREEAMAGTASNEFHKCSTKSYKENPMYYLTYYQNYFNSLFPALS